MGRYDTKVLRCPAVLPEPSWERVIGANAKPLIEQLEAGHSEARTAYLNAMSLFHNYGIGNILETASQTFCGRTELALSRNASA
jgi:hypothetical protein